MRGLFLLFMLFASTVNAVELSQQQQAQLRQGEVLLLEGDSGQQPGKTFTVFALMPATVKQVQTVLADFASYPQFMPNMQKVVVRESNDDGAMLEYYLALPAGMKKRYRLAMVYKSGSQSIEIHWHKLAWPGLDAEDTIRDTNGYWKLIPFEGQVLAEYHVYTDPGEVPFGFGWIVDYMASKSIREVVVNTRERVIVNRKEL